MALERQSIEKKDFPIGRRGYDPEAVDAHLARLADEIDQLKVSSRRRSETLASAASEQVRAIVEAAETSAAEIQRQAEEEAREIRAEAAEEAQATRQQASSQARDYVGRVSESTAGMLQRLDAMESELSALIESLRTGSNRLNADLQLLEGNLDEVRGAVAPRPRFESEPSRGGSFEPEAGSRTAAAPAAQPELPGAGLASESSAGSAAPVARPQTEAQSPLTVPGASAEAPAENERFDDAEAEEEDLRPAAGLDGEDETEGARLIALNMALNGTPREETDRYLSENFELRNRSALLDEVYSSVEG